MSYPIDPYIIMTKLISKKKHLVVGIQRQADQYFISFLFKHPAKPKECFKTWNNFVKLIKNKHKNTFYDLLGRVKIPLRASSWATYDFMTSIPLNETVYCKKNIRVVLDMIANFFNMTWLLFDDINWFGFIESIDTLELASKQTITLCVKKKPSITTT